MWRRGIDVAVALVLGASAGAAVHVAHRWEERGQAVAAEVASATLERSGPLEDRVIAVVARGVWAVEASGCGQRRQASVSVVDVPGVGVTAFTNAHVVAGAGTVELLSPTGERYVVDVGGAAIDRDVATIDVDPFSSLAEVLAESALVAGTPVEVGDLVGVAGYPDGQPEVASAPVVAAELRSARGGTSRVLIIDSQVVGGSSGGAVVDPTGEFVGLVAARDPSTGRAVAYPAEQVFAVLGTPGPLPGC